MSETAPQDGHDDLFDRDVDGERLRQVETLLAEVEAELEELDPPAEVPVSHPEA